MSLGPFTLLISRECDTYYKTRSQKLIHRVDALRFPHFVRLLKSGGRRGARAIGAALEERSSHATGEADEPPEGKLVEPIGIEPMTSCLQSRRSPS
jgi:hypothetical protein